MILGESLSAQSLLYRRIGEQFPEKGDLFWALVAGLSSGMGLVIYYKALSQGSMSFAAPVTGVVTAALPAVAGSMLEGYPSVFQANGFVLAFTSIAMITGLRKSHFKLDLQFFFAVSAGACFGLFLILMDKSLKARICIR